MNYKNRMYFASKGMYIQGKPQSNNNSKEADKPPS